MKQFISVGLGDVHKNINCEPLGYYYSDNFILSFFALATAFFL